MKPKQIFKRGKFAVVLFKESWYLCHYRNIKFYLSWPSPKVTRSPWYKYWFLNVQFFIFGLNKLNGKFSVRFFNFQVSFFW